MTEKTPAEIEIEKLEKEIDVLENQLKELAHNEEYCKTKKVNGHRIFCGNCEKLRLLKAKLSGFKQCLELGRKESEECKELKPYCHVTCERLEEWQKLSRNTWYDEGYKDAKEDLRQQLSNQKKEIIEKIKGFNDEDCYIIFKPLELKGCKLKKIRYINEEELIKQIEGEGQ